MLSRQVLLQLPGISVAEVHCTGEEAGWSAEEPVTSFGVVLVRSGLFRRRADGVELLADPVTGYVQRPGSVQRMAHPCGGDLCTAIALSRSTIGPVMEWPVRDGPLFTSSALHMAHRVLVARARQGADAFELSERATALVGGLLEVLASDLALVTGTAGGVRSLRAVDQVRQALTEDMGLRLDDLAKIAAMSTYHLSRTFRNVTGLTLSRYRIRLRVRRAIERLVGGDNDLAGLAAELGFADQAHLTRTLRAETGMTPRVLRAALTEGPAASGILPRGPGEVQTRPRRR